MTAVLKVDGYDLQPFLRVNPDDGLDPVDADRLQPQFGEAAGGEGDPLISIHEGNAEHIWPLHLTPLKTADFADSIDGLHAMVTDLNRRLKAAAQVEWRMDGATDSTFIDVVHARFEPDFNYRKQQRLWVSGVLRVWAKPYGHTGTSRIAATAAGHGFVAFAPATTTAGDTPAQLEVSLGGILADAVFAVGVSTSVYAGFCVAPTAARLFHPAASLVPIEGFGGTHALVGASGALGSQALRFRGANGILWHVALPDLDDLLVPGSRNRMLALARWTGASGAATTISLSTYDRHSVTVRAFGPTAVATKAGGVLDTGWVAFDLGTVPAATTPIGPQPRPAIVLGTPSGGASSFELSGVLMLPEEHTAFIADGTVAAFDVATYVLNHRDNTAARLIGGTSANDYTDNVHADLRGGLPLMPTGSGYKAAAFVLPDGGAHNVPLTVEVRCRERFTFQRG